jgi:glycosyltransferase involved in cell wall biosynthesis
MPTPSTAGRGPSRRVLVALHEEVLGGATLSILRCLGALEERGWEFVFWAPRPSEVFDRLAADGRAVGGAPRPLAYSLAALRLPPGALPRLRATPGYLRSFRAYLRSAGVSVLHANSLTTIGEAAAAIGTGTPVVFHLHEMAQRGRKGALAVRLVHRVGGEVVAVSSSCARSWALGAARPRIVYEGCRVPPAVPPLPDGSALVVGTIGVIARRKGIDVFLDAAELVARRGAAVEFRSIGAPTDPLDASWARAVLARAAALGVHHLPRADVANAIGEWDAFVLASRQDPFPISMLEAMASGRPVIGARVDGIAEQVTPDVGLLVEPENPSALADAIVALAELPADRRRAMGIAARGRAGQFSIERQADGIDAAYRAAIAR